MKPIVLLILSACLTSTYADDEGCPAIDSSSEAAQAWILEPGEYGPIARLKPNADQGRPELSFPLDIDGPSEFTVLDWVMPERYAGRIGMMQYYSGSAGTSAMADITRSAIVDLQLGKLIAIIEDSVFVTGARLVYDEEKDEYSYGESYSHCRQTRYQWEADHLLYTQGDDSYRLPLY